VFETRFHVEDDVLYAVGGGDPFLDAAALSTIAVRLDAHVSIASLSRLVVDDRAFSNSRFGPGYETGGVGESYQAPSGALSLEFNTVQVTVYAVAGSRRAGVSLFPASDHVRLHNRALVGGRKTRVSIRSEPQGDHTLVQVSGRLAEHAPPVVERRRIYDPARYTGGALAAELAEISGTEPLPVEPGEVPFGVDPVWVHESPPLLEIVDGGLAYSNNFVAEQLLRTLGWRLTGQPGDWENGNEVLSGYWSALGLDPQALHFINGSGFSLEGRMTTSGLVDLIGVSHRVQGTGAGLLAALPVAGEEGSLRARLRQSGKRVRAKTGTLDGVSGLSGVITAEDGTGQVAFSILINVKPGTMPAATRRDAADRIVMAVLHYVDDYESRRGFLRFEPMWVRAGTDAGTPAGTGAGAPGAVAASPG
jgi:D-alanyl-D-alanine carboxypeptidase/D-alanyl-D-alanine-endopeptidase (penicillin-binding protein 4)